MSDYLECIIGWYYDRTGRIADVAMGLYPDELRITIVIDVKRLGDNDKCIGVAYSIRDKIDAQCRMLNRIDVHSNHVDGRSLRVNYHYKSKKALMAVWRRVRRSRDVRNRICSV